MINAVTTSRVRCTVLRVNKKIFFTIFTHSRESNHINSKPPPKSPRAIFPSILADRRIGMAKKGFFETETCFHPNEFFLKLQHTCIRENHLHKSRYTPIYPRIFWTKIFISNNEKIFVWVFHETLIQMKLIHLSRTKISSPSKAVKRQNIKTDSIFAQVSSFFRAQKNGRKEIIDAKRFSWNVSLLFPVPSGPCFLSNILLLCFHGLATASFHFAVLSSEGMFQGVCLCGLNLKGESPGFICANFKMKINMKSLWHHRPTQLTLKGM